jgi:putative transposase
MAIVEYIDWYNHRRLHGEINYIPPVEHETNCYNTADPKSRSPTVTV